MKGMRTDMAIAYTVVAQTAIFLYIASYIGPLILKVIKSLNEKAVQPHEIILYVIKINDVRYCTCLT